jgi:hypothetical protein
VTKLGAALMLPWHANSWATLNTMPLLSEEAPLGRAKDPSMWYLWAALALKTSWPTAATVWIHPDALMPMMLLFAAESAVLESSVLPVEPLH